MRGNVSAMGNVFAGETYLRWVQCKQVPEQVRDDKRRRERVRKGETRPQWDSLLCVILMPKAEGSSNC